MSISWSWGNCLVFLCAVALLQVMKTAGFCLRQQVELFELNSSAGNELVLVKMQWWWLEWLCATVGSMKLNMDGCNGTAMQA